MRSSLESLQAFVAREGRGPSPSRPGSRVWVVGSGKGGVGTSTVAALLALAAAEREEPILLVDGDEEVGSQTLLFGLPAGLPGIGELRYGDLSPADLLHPVGEALWLLPGGGGAGEATLASAAARRRLLFQRVASVFEGFSSVIVDGGSRPSSVLAALAQGAEGLVTVTQGDRLSQAATFALVKSARLRGFAVPTTVVVNRSEGRAAEAVFRNMEVAFRRFLDWPVRFGGSVPEDPSLRTPGEEGRSLLEAVPGAPGLAAARRIVEIVGRSGDEGEGRADPA